MEELRAAIMSDGAMPVAACLVEPDRHRIKLRKDGALRRLHGARGIRRQYLLAAPLSELKVDDHELRHWPCRST